MASMLSLYWGRRHTVYIQSTRRPQMPNEVISIGINEEPIPLRQPMVLSSRPQIK